MAKLPFIEVSGSYYDVGFGIGQAMKHQIKKAVKIPENIAKEHKYFKFDYFIKTSKKYFPYANKYFPNLVSELKGIADGSNQDFDKVWTLNTEEIWGDQYFDKCTSIVLKEVDNNICLYHNEDFDYPFIDTLAVVKAEINKKVKFLSVVFAGMLPGSSVSLNSYGLVQGINSLHPTDYKVGVPKNFIARAVLECSSISTALKVIKLKERASAYNHILIKGNDVANIETTASKYNFMKIKSNTYAHSNHYLTKGFENNYHPEKSIKRLELVNKMLSNAKVVDKNTVSSILSSHDKSAPLCKHITKKNDDDVTLTSIIVDPANKKIYATKGNPCKNKFHAYSLD